MAKSLACQMGWTNADCTDLNEQKRRNKSNETKPWFPKKKPYTPDPPSSYKKVPKKS